MFLFFLPYLFISGPPNPPENIAVSVVSLTSVRVEWDPGFSGMIQSTFHIQYRKVGETDWIEVTAAASYTLERQSVDIAGLDADTDYVLRMFTSNVNGVSSITTNIYFSIRGMLKKKKVLI